MKLEEVSENLTFYWCDEPNFELHKALLFGTVSRSLKGPEERKAFNEAKGLTTKANTFFKDNLGFGDRSIAEQFNLNFELNNVPVTFSYEFLDFEFMSPIESSTRYLKIPKGYFYKFEHLAYLSGYDKYLENCDFSMDVYSRAFDDLSAFYKEKYPKESIDWKDLSEKDIEQTYNSTIKSKTADAVKIFLPMSVNTNLTVCMNARALQDLIGKLVYYNVLNDDYIKPFLDPLIKYVQENEQTKSLFSKLPEVIKVWSEKAANHEKRPNVTVLGEYWGGSGAVNAYNLTAETVPIVKNEMPRANRHDRIDRSYKLNQFVFECITSAAVIRDWNRHRQADTYIVAYLDPVSLIPNQDMKVNFMHYITEYIQDNCLDEIPHNDNRCLYYAGFPLGGAIKWNSYCNLYELSNIIELRSGKGGYWEYIQLARDMARSVGMDYNLFQEADMTTSTIDSLPTLRQNMKKVVAK